MTKLADFYSLELRTTNAAKTTPKKRAVVTAQVIDHVAYVNATKATAAQGVKIIIVLK